MSFFKAFATGFLEQTAKEITKGSDRVEEYVKADYVTNLEQARKNREERRAEKKQAEKAVSILKNFGIQDETKIANILDQNGYDGIVTLADTLQTAVLERGVTIDPETFITGIADENLTIEDAMKRLEGDLKYVEADVPVRADGDKSFWERTFGLDYAGSATRELEQAFGEDYRTVASEAAGEYIMEEPTGGATIDYTQLYKAKDIKNLTPEATRTAVNDFVEVIAGPMGLEVSYDTQTNTYVGRDVKTAKFQEALAIASDAAVLYDSLYVTYDENAAKARAQTIQYLQSQFNQPAPSEETTTTDTAPTTTEAPAMTPQEYAISRAQDMAIDTANPDVRNVAIGTIQRELRTRYKLNTQQINEIIKGL
jgi:hypothetical protein